jgi:predicted HicB family RNase H-like nuclease
MTYHGYEAVVGFDDDAKVFYGEVINTRDVITFQGTSVEELETAFHDSVDDYLEFCDSRNEAPEKPVSGKFVVRLTPELHRQALTEARREGKSLNTFVTDAIKQRARRP